MGMGDGVYVKSTTCRHCGGRKVTRSRTAYVYCDYCGALADWDFQTAMASPASAPPGPKYEAIVRAMQPELDAAKAQGDRRRYAAAQAKIYDEYVTACPASVPPRVRDPAYRHAFVVHTALSMMEQAFDPRTSQATEAMTAATSRLAWDRSDPRAPKVRPDAFWPMWSAVRHMLDLAIDVNEQSGTLQHHPDKPPRDLVLRMGLSTFVQGWLPYLPAADGAKLLEESGLGGDYQIAPVVVSALRHCGGCGRDLPTASGARRIVCEACGRLVDVTGAEIGCHGCGAAISLPLGGNSFACPYCQREMSALRPLG
jgi:DNA-directed RNA polymerase subunit RPC12/RpoP